ncbi:MAG: hypothetical protein RQ922_00695 [Thermoproteota archaeon]|jgi:Mn-dependent DtxR family transcriptional regulator|nr:hypothetical protein [Thermoproteota archaeon]
MRREELKIEEKILLYLNSSRAYSSNSSKSKFEIANHLNIDLSLLEFELKKLKDDGYIEYINDNVYITGKGIIRLMSRFS